MCVLSSINKIMFLFAENLRLNLSPNKGKIASGSWNSSGNQARFSDTWNQVNYPQNSVFWNEKQRVSRWIFLFFKKRICFFFPLAIGDSHQRFWGWAAKRSIICGGHRVGRPNFGPSHRKSIWIHSDQDDPEVRIFQSALSSTSCAFFSGKFIVWSKKHVKSLFRSPSSLVDLSWMIQKTNHQKTDESSIYQNISTY